MLNILFFCNRNWFCCCNQKYHIYISDYDNIVLYYNEQYRPTGCKSRLMRKSEMIFHSENRNLDI